MSHSIWWHLAMEFHYMGTATGHAYRSKARDCLECQRIAAVVERFGRE